MFEWISEGKALPPIAQKVFLAVPRQHDKFWDIYVAQLLVRYEGVSPKPIVAGERWPTEYWWSTTRDSQGTVLLTGNSWWASFRDIPLPPGAQHATDREFNYIARKLAPAPFEIKPNPTHTADLEAAAKIKTAAEALAAAMTEGYAVGLVTEFRGFGLDEEKGVYSCTNLKVRKEVLVDSTEE